MDIKKIISEMTFEEKATLLTGAAILSTAEIERLGIGKIEMSDGPHGVRRLLDNPDYSQKSNIDGGDCCFPTASALASSWNREVAFSAGQAIALDCKEEGIDLLLAPAVNMKRLPNCGRNFEYYSEDPYLAGIIGAEFINGIQSEGIGTSLKHYAMNNQELYRGNVSVEADERTMREYYIKVFEILLKHCNPTTVMCAYNKVNGIWCAENRYLLTELLKEEWGYDGLVASDWGAVHDIGKSLRAGLDLQMPANKNISSQLKAALDNNIVEMSDIDRAVKKMLEFVDRITNMATGKKPYDRAEQHKKAYDAACECITLLKNDNDVLPITKEKYKKVVFFGNSLTEPVFMGGGSSCVSVEVKSVDRPIDFIRKNAEGIEIDFCPDVFEFKNGLGVANGNKMDLFSKGQYDAAVIFIGAPYFRDSEAEAVDRDVLRLPNYVNRTILEVTNMFKNVAVVIQTGSPIIPYRWENAPAVIQMWLCGEAGGSAIADILFGKVNPSGKLSETFMKRERTDLDYPGDGIKVKYTEGVYVGYRYYDKHPEEIWFPFGHGISYTAFAYSDLKIDKKNICSDKFGINISLKVKNIGNMAGKEAVQLYISKLDSVVDRPVKELCGFDKIYLEAGEEKEVKFTLTEYEFAYYNICLHAWHVESGTYKIMAGASSQDIRLSDTVFVNYLTDYSNDRIDGSMLI